MDAITVLLISTGIVLASGLFGASLLAIYARMRSAHVTTDSPDRQRWKRHRDR